VQAFLVTGGFLAARSLVPRLGAPRIEAAPLDVPVLLWRRYVRLARPYLAALTVAIGCAALARGLIQHPATPPAPSLGQVLAHVFLLQDILGREALSAGVWYVAIDFQLYTLLVLLLWSTQKVAAATGTKTSRLALLMCAGLGSASLFWLNRNPAIDVWAPYFFGAYSLGILAQWIAAGSRKGRWMILLALLVSAALAVEWRSRILVAGVTALLLAWSAGAGFAPRWASSALVARLGRISYSVFLIHYPVCLVTSAVVFRLWPTSPGANATGIVAAWLLSLGAGAILHRVAEPVPAAYRR
jgi:peptidoglycan/LPS O-acetylase OafA/YrhL